ncbi:MAG: hypothetical protein KME28_04260 [Pelatocladus maniniholoensis HA4357-MV3]|uniref:Uncharacterized protein n=1 Tax=Pelatocladus maniniholoensis HA4357-MV3 TaxID=1117104 RepID=A0A9E3H6F4_9NOST|nr:hypothetical protein [Pelatocladus maniniholoensis HA4357-MV3]
MHNWQCAIAAVAPGVSHAISTPTSCSEWDIGSSYRIPSPISPEKNRSPMINQHQQAAITDENTIGIEPRGSKVSECCQ